MAFYRYSSLARSRCSLIRCNSLKGPGHARKMSCVLRAYMWRPSVILMLYLHVSVACRSSLSPLPTILLSTPQFLTSPLMSHSHPTSTSSNFQQVFENALKEYQMRTKENLLTHPLAHRFENCDSASGILAILQEQAEALDESQRRNGTFLNSTVNVLHAFSETFGNLVCLTSSTCLRSVLSCEFHRQFHLQKSSLLESAFSYKCVSFLICSRRPL